MTSAYAILNLIGSAEERAVVLISLKRGMARLFMSSEVINVRLWFSVALASDLRMLFILDTMLATFDSRPTPLGRASMASLIDAGAWEMSSFFSMKANASATSFLSSLFSASRSHAVDMSPANILQVGRPLLTSCGASELLLAPESVSWCLRVAGILEGQCQHDEVRQWKGPTSSGMNLSR